VLCKGDQASQKPSSDIWRALTASGTILENVVIDSGTRPLNLDSDAKRRIKFARMPRIESSSPTLPTGTGGHPAICYAMLTADAFGVMPPG